MKRIFKFAALLAATLFVFAACDKKEGDDPDKTITIEKTWRFVHEVPKGEPGDDPMYEFVVIKDNIFNVGIGAKYYAEHHGLTGLDNYVVVYATGTYVIEPATETTGKITVTRPSPYYEGETEVHEANYSELTAKSVRITHIRPDGAPGETAVLEAWSTKMTLITFEEFDQLIDQQGTK